MKNLTLLAFLGSLFFAQNALAEVAVIVHKDNSQNLNKAMIKRIFLSKIKIFPGGEEIQSGGLPASDPVTVEFNKKVLRKSPSQMKAYWSKLVFTGTGAPTKVYQSAGEIINMVKSNTNGIAFVDAGAVTEEVRVLARF